MPAANAPPASHVLRDAGSLSGQAAGGDGAGALPRADRPNLDTRGVGCPTPDPLWDLIGAAAIARRRDHPGERPRVESNAAWIRGAVVERLARCEVAVPEPVQERLREMDR